jgi:hypothetical protein
MADRGRIALTSGERERRSLLVIGAVAVVVGFGLVFESAAVGGAVLVFGFIIAALGAFIGRATRIKLTATGVDADLSGQPHGAEFARAAAGASDESLEAMIPLLREDLDVATAVISLPADLDGTTLVDQALHWMRQEYNVQVFAAKRPSDRHWRGGGRISTLRLTAGTELAVAGDRADIAALKQRLKRSEA